VDTEELDQLLSRAEVGRLRSILEGRDDAVLSLAADDMTLLWANRPGAQGVFGRAEEQYQGKDARSFVHTDDVRDWERGFRRALDGATVRWEGRALAESGTWMPVRSIMWRTQSGTEILAVTTPMLDLGAS
jgi:transcriptional regulator of aromatic amino acid metabolism